MSPTAVEKPRDPLASLRIKRDEPPRRSGRGRRWLRRLIVLTVLAGAGGAGLVAAWRGGLLDVAEMFQPPPEVRVGTVSVETGRAGDAVVRATGYLESRRQAKIGARGAGRIETLDVEEGTRVTKGQVLAVLEHADLEAALSAAKATLKRSEAEVGEQEVEIARTKKDFDRVTKLRASKAASEAEHDEARFRHEGAVKRMESLRSAVALADARVREAEQVIENMLVRAPFDGTVISKDAELGESILPGGLGEGSGRGSVVTIADLEHLEVECDVKEDYIGRIRAGLPAEVAVDAVPDRRYNGRVRKIIPMGDRARATIKVQVEILDADERLFPEMSSTVFFLPEGSEGKTDVPERRIHCPSDAVVTADGASHAWVVGDEGLVRRVEVTAGKSSDGRTEIVSGLSGGERVVLRPSEDLREGSKVKVAE